MYQPTHFQQTDRAAVATLIDRHPLATVVALQGGELGADHIPLRLEPGIGEHGVLRGHVARANPLWSAADGQPVLAIFTGPQAYVSPSWYPSKALTAKAVPTWNYAVVHAHGRLRAVQDAAWLHAFLTTLTDRHEAAHAHPWRVSDAPADYLERMLQAIVGIEIELTRIDAKWKLSQNRSSADRLGVIAGLSSQDGADAQALAALMRGQSEPPV